MIDYQNIDNINNNNNKNDDIHNDLNLTIESLNIWYNNNRNNLDDLNTSIKEYQMEITNL